MFISVTIDAGGHSLDIKIDAEQKIDDVLRTLQAHGKFPQNKTPSYFRSMLNQRLVSVNKTFAEEEIFDGDKLVVI